MIPGEIITNAGEIEINAGAAAFTIEVANGGDRPIQVGSHYHFFETNDPRCGSKPASVAKCHWFQSRAGARFTVSGRR